MGGKETTYLEDFLAELESFEDAPVADVVDLANWVSQANRMMLNQ